MLHLVGKRYLYLGLAAVIAAIVLWFVHKRDKKVDAGISCAVLAPDVREKIIIDPRRNKLTVITKERTDELFLPDRPTSIEIPHTGPIRITRRTYGFEMAPFASLVVTDTLRAGVGIDGFYWHRFNVGSGIGLNIPNLIGNDRSSTRLKSLLDVRFFTQVSYNVWSNTSIGLVLDTQKNIGMAVSFRF